MWYNKAKTVIITSNLPNAISQVDAIIELPEPLHSRTKPKLSENHSKQEMSKVENPLARSPLVKDPIPDAPSSVLNESVISDVGMVQMDTPSSLPRPQTILAAAAATKIDLENMQALIEFTKKYKEEHGLTVSRSVQEITTPQSPDDVVLELSSTRDESSDLGVLKN